MLCDYWLAQIILLLELMLDSSSVANWLSAPHAVQHCKHLWALLLSLLQPEIAHTDSDLLDMGLSVLGCAGQQHSSSISYRL